MNFKPPKKAGRFQAFTPTYSKKDLKMISPQSQIVVDLRQKSSFLEMNHLAAEQYVKHLFDFDIQVTSHKYGPVVLVYLCFDDVGIAGGQWYRRMCKAFGEIIGANGGVSISYPDLEEHDAIWCGRFLGDISGAVLSSGQMLKSCLSQLPVGVDFSIGIGNFGLQSRSAIERGLDESINISPSCHKKWMAVENPPTLDFKLVVPNQELYRKEQQKISNLIVQDDQVAGIC